MKNNRYICILSSFLLLLSVACNKESDNDNMVNRDNSMLVKIQIKHPTATTRAYLGSNPNGGVVTGIRWNKDERVKLFVRQNEQISDLAEWPLEDISSDGKVAFVEFRLPGQIDQSKPYELYGISQYFATSIQKNAEGKDILLGTFSYNERYEWIGGLESWRKVPWCFETTVNQWIAIVEVRQLAAYEFINLKNATDDTHNTYLTKIEADDCWYYKTCNVQFPGTIVTGENEGFLEGDFRYHNSWNQTVACYTFYFPNGKRPTNVRFHFTIDKKDYVTTARSSNIDILPGHAYHYWLIYDGNSLTFDKDHPGNVVDDGKLDDVPGYEL